MTAKNDNTILNLKKKIKDKKATLRESIKFSPRTNCNLEILANRYNIRTLNIETVTSLLVIVNSMNLSAIDLDIDYIYNGYPIEDWVYDLKDKLDDLKLQEDRKKLEVMEAQLEKLLSSEKKTELEILKIAEELE